MLRNVRNDKMGNWIWVCEGLVIVFLTETLGGFDASLVAECCRRRKRQKGRSDVWWRLRKRRSSRSIVSRDTPG